MNNAELIKALRRCSYTTVAGADREDGYCKPCAYFEEDPTDITCIDRMMIDAADALEADDKRIAELSLDNKMLKNTIDADKGVMLDRIRFLEAQLPKEGECEAKKPKTVKETEYSFYCDCPTCGGRLISNVDGEWCAGSFDRFCRMCGQKIDWSEYCGRSNMPRGAKMKGEQGMSEPKLKPCPFCGGEAELRMVGDMRYLLVYSCKDCRKTPLRGGDAQSTERDARKIWNRRVDAWNRRANDDDN